MGHGGMNFDSARSMEGPKFPHSVLDHAGMGPGKRMEELGNPPTMVGDPSNLNANQNHQVARSQIGFPNSAPSESIIPLSMDFPGMPSMSVNTNNSYDGFPDHLSVGSSMSSGQMSNMSGMNVASMSSPMRQNSGSWSSQSVGPGIPRSVPDYDMSY